MRAAGMQDKGLSIKIETRSAFDALAAIILATLEWPKCGIMIARGDGRVHWGDLRLAEIQNEITWACAAAHCPVIWATGVLEELSKRCVVRNAEITDAHKGIDHANCVMLNKGSYVERSITLLADLARVVRRHASGKYPLLGPLSMAKRYTQ
jgi:pyruvate kinase